METTKIKEIAEKHKVAIGAGIAGLVVLGLALKNRKKAKPAFSRARTYGRRTYRKAKVYYAKKRRTTKRRR